MSRDAADPDSIIEADGVKYEFLLLATAVEHERKVAGVIAITCGVARAQTAQHMQLLAAIAAELLR